MGFTCKNLCKDLPGMYGRRNVNTKICKTCSKKMLGQYSDGVFCFCCGKRLRTRFRKIKNEQELKRI